MSKYYNIRREDRIYEDVKTSSAAPWFNKALDQKANQLGIPKSRLISNLIFNCLVNNYDDEIWKIELPDISHEPYVEGKYTAKAGTMLRMVEKFVNGATLEDLALLYREMGFKDLEEMMLAHRELVKVGMLVEETRKNPYTSKMRKVFVPDYLTKKLVEKKQKTKKLKALEKIEEEKGPLDD